MEGDKLAAKMEWRKMSGYDKQAVNYLVKRVDWAASETIKDLRDEISSQLSRNGVAPKRLVDAEDRLKQLKAIIDQAMK